MKKIALIIAVSAILCAQQAEAAPALTAILTHDNVEHGADGITRSTHYQERFIRNENRVWIERVLPAPSTRSASSQKVHLHAAHDELNIQLAPRLIGVTDQGAAQLTLVDEEQHVIYAVGAEDYERTGFSGRWLAEQSLIDPASLRRMRKLSRPAPAGATWYTQETPGEYTRILWNERLKFPLVIETGSHNGHISNRTSVKLSAVGNTPRPWRDLGEYRQRELSDLGD